MAAPTFIGICTVWGIDGTIQYTGPATATDSVDPFQIESYRFNDGTDLHEGRDKQGEVNRVQLYNPKREMDIKFFPAASAGTGSIAKAKMNMALPTKGAKVTIASMAGNGTAGVEGAGGTAVQNISTWLYLGGGSIEESNTGEAYMNLHLVRYNTDIAATANT